MMTYFKSQTWAWLTGAVALVISAMFVVSGHAQTKDPIKIGFAMALTGPLAANGKMSLVAMQIWEDDMNAKGGLLGRPVKLIYYDDQSSPAQVPSIYAKLLDIDKVDLIVSGYASTQIAAAMPTAIGRKKLFVSLFGTGVNETFNYSKYFSMIPNGPTPKPAFTRGFFKVAEVQKSQAANDCVGRCGRRIRTQCLRRRPREREGVWLQSCLRQELSADDGGLHVDRAGDPINKPGSPGGLLVSARHRWHGQGDA